MHNKLRALDTDAGHQRVEARPSGTEAWQHAYPLCSRLVSLMQHAIWSQNCAVDCYITSTHVLEPQRISDAHEEGDLIAELVYDQYSRCVDSIRQVQASTYQTRTTSLSTDDTHTSLAIRLRMQACRTGATFATPKLRCYQRAVRSSPKIARELQTVSRLDDSEASQSSSTLRK